MPPKHEGIINVEIGEMLEAGVITPSKSPWGLALVVVTRMDGKSRVCVDL